MPKYTAGIMVNLEQVTVLSLDKLAKAQKTSRTAKIRQYITEGLEREISSDG